MYSYFRLIPYKSDNNVKATNETSQQKVIVFLD